MAEPLSVRSLLLAIAGVSAVALGGFGAFDTVRDFRDARGQALDRADAAAVGSARSVGQALRGARATVAETVAKPYLATVIATPGVDCSFSSDKAGLFPSHIELMDSEGRVRCSSVLPSTRLRGASYAGFGWAESRRSGPEPRISDTFRDPMTGLFSIAVYAEVVQEGRSLGKFAEILNVEDVGRNLARSAAERPPVEVIVIEESSDVVLSASADAAAAGDDAEGPAFEGSQSSAQVGLDGTTRFFRERLVDETGWRILTGIDAESALAEARSRLWRRAKAWVVTLFALIGLALLIYRRIARPLRVLISAIQTVGREAGGEIKPISGPSEITTLADEFNAMLRARTTYEERLMHQAFHDSLTGLPNRAVALERIEAAVRDTRRPEEVAVLFIDLDRFKVLNDSLGHEAGDRVLLEVAARLQEAVRGNDLIARFGADEFVIVCEKLKRRQQSFAVAERIQRVLHAPFAIPTGLAVLTASTGIAFNRDQHDEAEDLLRDANAAMHVAKKPGRGPYEIFDNELREMVTTRLELEADLRVALDREEIAVHFQPKVDMRTGLITGCEALVRWNHPTRGWIPPPQFVGVAEDTGLIGRLGGQVLKQATRDLTTWQRAAGYKGQVSVNLSGRQFDQPDLAETISRVIHSNGLDASLVIMEITEAVLVDDIARVGETIDRLKEIGVGLSLDDFGTGYSSLAYLRRFPFDELKIDKAFVHDLGAPRSDDAVVHAIVAMGQALDLKLVAEGVETEAHRRRLLELGCETGQGYLLGRPQPTQELIGLLQTGVPAPAG